MRTPTGLVSGQREEWIRVDKGLLIGRRAFERVSVKHGHFVELWVENGRRCCPLDEQPSQLPGHSAARGEFDLGNSAAVSQPEAFLAEVRGVKSQRDSPVVRPPFLCIVQVDYPQHLATPSRGHGHGRTGRGSPCIRNIGHQTQSKERWAGRRVLVDVGRSTGLGQERPQVWRGHVGVRMTLQKP